MSILLNQYEPLHEKTFSCTPERVFPISTCFNKADLVNLYKIKLVHDQHVLQSIGCTGRQITWLLSGTSQNDVKIKMADVNAK